MLNLAEQKISETEYSDQFLQLHLYNHQNKRNVQ